MHSIEKHRTQQIIVEIIRQAGGKLSRKTSLFRMFYFAHLIYAERAPTYLSNWPIIKMPHGPGIEAADLLLGELAAKGVIAVECTAVGPYAVTAYRFTGKDIPGAPLPDEAMGAIKEAVEFVQKKSVAELAELTHEFSRSWNACRDGEHLNIYIDCIPDHEFERRDTDLRELQRTLTAAWDVTDEPSPAKI